jgi:hypothetical protein
VKHRRAAIGRHLLAKGGRWLAIAGVLMAIGIASLPSDGSGNTSSVPAASVPIPSGSVVVGPLSEATPISSEFWGVNVAVAQRFNGTDANSIAATPVTYIRFPGGILGEQFNYTSGVITNDTGVRSQATTSTGEFVAACKQIGCHAIMQLPAEINSSSAAAYYAAYVVHTLDFQPAYWEIGNDPSGWNHFDVPWSEWATKGGGNITPAPFAKLVHAYIGAVLGVDPDAKFLALGTGMGTADYAKSWVKELASVDGHELSGISIHSYIEGSGPSDPTDAELFANLEGVYSLPTQIAADRQFIQEACANCSELPLFVTEINAAELSSYNELLPTFAGTLYLAAETVQGLSLQVTNLDWFAYDSHFSGSWSQEPLKWQMQYYLFSDLMTHLGSETLPTSVTGPSTVYGMATYTDSRLSLLLVNVNTTSSVRLNLSEAGFSTSTSRSEYLWANGTPLPVESQLSASDSLVLPPLSIVVLSGPALTGSTSFPLTFTESGLPSATNWSVTVNGTSHSSLTPTISFLEPNGSYAYSVQPPDGYYAATDNGSVTISGSGGSVPVEFSLISEPAFSVTFSEAGLPAGTPWTVTVNGSISASTTSAISFWEGNGSYPYSIGGIPGYTTEPSSGAVEVNGSAVSFNVTFVPEGAIYAATVSETGLAANIQWNVTVGGTPAEALSPWPVIIGLSNGTFAYTVGSVQGYSARPAGGWLTIEGAGTTVSISFDPISGNSSNRINTVEGGVSVSNGSTVADLGLTLIFRGGVPPIQWLNLTTDSVGRFIVSGVNLSGNLSAVEVDSPAYQVRLTSVAWRGTDLVNVTVVLQPVQGSPRSFLPGVGWPSFMELLIFGLSGVAATLNGALIRTVRRNRRMARYRQYFAHPPR